MAVCVLNAQVLREALAGEPGTVQSDESSLSLPSIPTSRGEGKQGELAQKEPGKGVPALAATPGSCSGIAKNDRVHVGPFPSSGHAGDGKSPAHSFTQGGNTLFQ